MVRKFSVQSAALPVYQSMHMAINDLRKKHAIEVLELVIDHFGSMLEGLQQELQEENE